MLAAIDSNLEGMALSLGASRWRVFRTVTLPLAHARARQRVPAAVRGIARRLRDAADPRRQPVPGAADAGLPADHRPLRPARRRRRCRSCCWCRRSIVFLLQRYWVGRRFYVTVTGKGAGQTPFDSISPWRARRAARRACALVALVDRLLLRAAAVRVAGRGARRQPHVHARSTTSVIFTEGLQAIRDTLIIAAFAMPLGGLYGVLLGYLVARKAVLRAGAAMELVSMINYALPGTIVGIAYLIAFNDPPIALTGTRADHHRLLRVPLRPDRHPRDGGAAAADRPEPRGSLAGPGRGERRRRSGASRCR